MTETSKKYLWVEEYRPKKLNEYVFHSQSHQQQIESWVKDGNVPNLLLVGGPGTGKTALVQVLLNEIDINEFDILRLNGSKENNVDTVRDKIYNFAATLPFGKIRVVFLDEADFFSLQAQGILRNLIESFSDTCRFILTANYDYKIIPALRSRLQELKFQAMAADEYRLRMGEVLFNEGIEFDVEVLDTYIRSAFPDLRKGINLLQQYSKNGKLQSAGNSLSASTQDYLVKVIELFRQKKLTEARKVLLTEAPQDQYDDVYRFLYRNLDFFGDTEQQTDQAIIIIARGLRDHSISIDPEINLSACLAQLVSIR